MPFKKNPRGSGTRQETLSDVMLTAASLVPVLLFLAGSAYSQPLDLNVPVCTATDQQTEPAIASDGNGGSIITWQDLRNGNDDIYAQRLNSSGDEQWISNGVVICTTSDSQQQPMIVSDGAGGAIIAWQDRRIGSNFDIYAQRVNSDGAVLWTSNGVPVCTAAFDQIFVKMISDGLGGAILTWEDNRANVVNCPDVYAARLDSGGNPVWTANGVSVCNEASAQHGPMLCSDGSGGAFLTWYDQRAGDYDIYTQRVGSGGAAQWTTNGVATCTMATDQLNPDICTDGAGGVIITWYDYRSTTDYNIYAQRQGPGGAVVWAVDGIVMNNNTGYNQINPKIVSDGAFGAIIAWQDYITGTTADVYAQRVNSTGTVQWTATGVIICTAAGDQIEPQIVSDGLNGAFITWEDHRNDPNTDVYAQRIDASSAINWSAEGYLICGASDIQSHPAIISDGNNAVMATWQDHRNGNYDIYAQGFGVFGTGIEGGLVCGLVSPSILQISSIYPNPFSSTTTIRFESPDFDAASFEVFDMAGRLVGRQDLGAMSAGQHVASWNGYGTGGELLTNGVYMVRLMSGSESSATARIVLLR